jgi:hypothetical protein
LRIDDVQGGHLIPVLLLLTLERIQLPRALAAAFIDQALKTREEWQVCPRPFGV